jgi:hypothetical protein
MQTAPAQTILLGTFDRPTDTHTGVTSGTSRPIKCEGFDELVFTFESIGVTSGGTILIEEATRPVYSGTWSQIASISASSFTGTAQATESALVAQHEDLARQVAAINAQGVQVERDLIGIRGGIAALLALKGTSDGV